MTQDNSRRDFLKTSAVAGGVLAANWGLVANAHAQGTNETIKVGLVGCGGRGSGAVEQNLRADSNIKLVAVADVFQDKAAALLTRLRRTAAVAEKVDVPAERVLIGLDAHRQMLPLVDLVILATPPGFRPGHIQAAIAARKHVFTEKPVAVDGPGIRTVLAAYETANQQHTAVVAGTQRRYQTGYIESMKHIHDGDIGKITSARCYWNQGTLWHRNREPGMTDVEWQIRNWLYFTWLSGDHICEQHVHNLDVINWALGKHPVRCTSLGGRQVRTGPEFGNIFDHFATDYEYPDGVHVLSQCRQIAGCDGNVSEGVTGTQGSWASGGYRITGEKPWSFPRGNDNQPYDAEHVALYQSIRNGRPINDLKNVAESTLTAIMGRMSAYTGKTVTWEQALNSQMNLMPRNLTWDMELPVAPVATPGKTPLT
jgi:myo-inositol 2-dehydrogenase / D-chiro-inositol 1-dehydrogenase